MNENAPAIDLLWVLVCSGLVMLMQAGFCLLETGFARAKNSINVAIKNMIDFCISGLAFWAFGYALMFGATWLGIFGTSDFLPGVQWDARRLTFFFFQLMFCSTSTTIISGAVAERIRFPAYLIVAVVVSGLVYPIFGHWAWGGALEGQPSGWLARRGFVDFAGSTVVHSVGAWVSLVLVLLLGPRIGRFRPGAPPMHGHSLTLSTLGALLLWFGWFGFNGGSTLGFDDRVPLVLINTNLAAAAGGLSALFIAWVCERLANVSQAINGVIAGLVAVTASCHAVDPLGAVAIGVVGGVIVVFATYLLERLKIDDVVGAIPVHGFCGVWGTLAVALFGYSERLGTGLTFWQQLGVQCLGIAECFVWTAGISLVVFGTLSRFWRMRVTSAEEHEGLNVAEHGATSELTDLLVNMQTQREQADFTKRVHVEPHTEVGQIAAEYNRVLQRVTSEITGREQAADAARAAEEKYRSIFENAVEGIFQTTPPGQYLSANPKLAQIYGYASAEEMMTELRDIQRQLYVDDTRRNDFRRLLDATDTISGFESQVYRRDGQVIWISENARSIRDAAGNLLYYEGTVEDITQKKVSAELEAEKEAALASSRAKSAFLANMSHEIRTPLNGVIGMLELLGSTTLDTRQERYVRIARSSADTLLGLINDILDFSKIEAGKLELEVVPFDLAELLEDVVEMLGHKAADKRLELSCRVLPDVPHGVAGDPGRLRQVLLNLLNNAIKFTEQGEVSLRAELLGEGEDRTVVRFAVQDSGIGIPADRKSRLFNPFMQVDASTTRKYGGTGLGLAICKQIIELMGGRIGCESTPGKGSTFWCEVPLAAAPEGERICPQPPPQLVGVRVLAVDDTQTNLDILREQLSPCGLEVTTIGDPLEALKQLRLAARDARPYSLAILDHNMPGMDGLQLASQIRRDKLLAGTRVLMLSSVDRLAEREQWDQLGLSGVLAKPIRGSRLVEEIATVLKGSAPTAAVAAPAAAGVPQPRNRKARLLVVEDNDINQQVVCEILQSTGYEVSIANHGQEGIAALEQGGFDLVLMDCQMPVMDGFTASRRIRELEQERKLPHAEGGPIPIIALTANAVRGDREQCLAAGMNDYTTKPIDRAALLAAVAKQLEALPMAGAVAAAPLPPPAPPPTPTPAAPKPNLTPAINMPVLKTRLAGDEAFIKRMLGQFQGRIHEDRKRLSEALDAGDSEKVRKLAHALKGASGNLAATTLSGHAATLETMTKQGAANPRECWQQLTGEMDRCLEQIEQLLHEADASAPART